MTIPGIDTGKRVLKYATKVASKASSEAVGALGIEDQVESFGGTVESLPMMKQLKKVVKTAAKEIFGEELPLYKDKAGPHKVKTHCQTFVDETRGREVPVTAYYPEVTDGEKSPVVVLSHGLAGNAATYRYLGKHLASHGYTVLQPTHVGSNTTATILKTPLFAFTQEELVNRSKDLSFCLDLIEDGQLPEELTRNADMERVGLAGHSFGALTTQAMAGVVTRDDEGNVLDLKDDRFDAFIAMSPYGDTMPTHLLGMDIGSYKEIKQPVLFMNGEKDEIFTLGKGSKAHSLPYQEAGSADKYHLIIGGGYHVSFAQVIGLADPETADLTKSTSTAFLDAHLKDEQPAEAYLADEFARVARSRDSLAYVGRDCSSSC